MKVFKSGKRYIIILIILSCIYAYFSLQTAIYISYLIDGLLFHNNSHIPNYLNQIIGKDTLKGMLILSVIIIGLNGIVGIVQYIRQRVATTFTLKVSSNIKKKLYAHILNLSYQSYQSCHKVEMLQRANEDAQEYAKFYKVQFNLILDIVSLSFFVISQSMVFNTSITIYLMITIVIMLLFAIWYARAITPILEKVILKKKKMLGAIINNVNQFKFIKIYNRQKQEIQKFKQWNEDYTKEEIRFIKLVLFYEITSEHITYLRNPIIYLLGGIAIMKGTMTMGTLTALLLFANKILNTIYSFGENIEVFDNFLIINKKIKRLLALEEEKNLKDSYQLNGDIVFSNVSIEVANKKMVSNLNFVIQKGEKIAIIGENGSGKTMLAKAILGFIPVKGDIYLNHHNIKKLNPSNIREYVDFISGEADLFTGTILDNIVLHQKGAEKQLIKVSKEAEILEDIKQFEKGYETTVGEKGIKLSGGQKQRILLARACLRNKPIMIFDNAFCKLDNQTANQIFENLKIKYPKTTMIFITHKQEIRNYIDKVLDLSDINSVVN